MTVRDLLAALAVGGPVPGRHVIVTAHPDDEAISLGGALCAIGDAQLLQLTDGVHADAPDRSAQVARRRRERAAACDAGRWLPAGVTIDGAVPGRTAHIHLATLLTVVTDALAGADVVWTHPYEGGHLDHDSAAWLVQTACTRIARPPRRMEFASYFSQGVKRDTFGAFWPDPTVPQASRLLTGAALLRKRAAIEAYASQASILRKFPRHDVEHYRQAPVYDFTRAAAPPAARWDVKGYQPTTTIWRATVAAATREVSA